MEADNEVTLESALLPYLEMLERKTRGDISDLEFQEAWVAAYLGDDTWWPDDVFNVLDTVFATAESYVDDAGVRPEIAGAVGPDELHRYAAAAIPVIRRLMSTKVTVGQGPPEARRTDSTDVRSPAPW